MSEGGETAEGLRYPVGRFQPPAGPMGDEERAAHLDALEGAPAALREAVEGLDGNQLDTPYRPGGWTVRQVVHHLADSHMNGYVRMRWALTEEEPVLKTYEQARWAELADARSLPVRVSLDLVDALHFRLGALLGALSREEFSRAVRHPGDGVSTVEGLLALYAWHGRHHTAQIRSLRDRKGW